MEGTCSGRLGYIISVNEIIQGKDGPRGKIVDGGAEFRIRYSAIVYRPFRGEVVDGVVASVNKVSLEGLKGGLGWFGVASERDGELTCPAALLHSQQMGIFADVGPMSCFISTHVSPSLTLGCPFLTVPPADPATLRFPRPAHPARLPL